jgi:protein O-GlcNAc transferase
MTFETVSYEMLRAADSLLSSGDWASAEQTYKHLYRTYQDDANIHAGMGFATYKQNRKRESARHFANACMRKQEARWILFLADLLTDLDQPVAAYRLYFYLERDGEDRVTRDELSNLRQRLGDKIDATVKQFELAKHSESGADDSAPAQMAVAKLAEALTGGKKIKDVIRLGEKLRKKFPRSVGLSANLGLAYKRTGDFDSAEKHYVAAFIIAPDHGATCANYGNLMLEQGKIDYALSFLEACVIADPLTAVVWSNLAAAYNQTGTFPVEAEFAARKSLSMPEKLNKTTASTTHRLLASALTRQGRTREALIEFGAGFDEDDNDSITASLLTMVMDDATSPERVSEAHLDYGRSLEESAKITKPPSLRKAWPDNLSIGFVSADFRDHSVSYFALPLMEQLALQGHRVVAYYNFGREDAVTQIFKSKASDWRRIRGLPDDEVAALITDDKIDVLIDLSGHTAGHRLPVFFRRPAPVQMTWLGHPASTGLTTIDARVPDSVADPPGAEARYSERLIRMPDTFCVYRPLVRYPEKVASDEYAVKPPPASVNGYITFGSCNTLSKYSDTTIAMWSNVLRSVSGSKLLIESPGLQTVALERQLLARFQHHGISSDRLDLRGRDRGKQYLIYNEIDICLDTYPLTGGTTNFDLLWMGVPLVTLAGPDFGGRMGATLLSSIKRFDWIADTEDDFVRIAINIAADQKTLSANRLQQRGRMEESPLMDEVKFAECFLQGIRQVWESKM